MGRWCCSVASVKARLFGARLESAQRFWLLRDRVELGNGVLCSRSVGSLYAARHCLPCARAMRPQWVKGVKACIELLKPPEPAHSSLETPQMQCGVGESTPFLGLSPLLHNESQNLSCPSFL